MGDAKKYIMLVTVLDPDGALITHHEPGLDLAKAASRIREVVNHGLLVGDADSTRLYPPHRVLLAAYLVIEDPAEPSA